MIFYLGVIIPATVEPADAEDWVYQRLSDTTWPESRCTCIGEMAEREARDAAHKLVPLSSYEEYLQANAEFDPEVVRRNWENIRNQWLDALEKQYSEHPMRWLPNAECETCGGTGRLPSYKRSIKFRGFSPREDSLPAESFLKTLEEGQTPFHLLLEPDGALSKIEREVFPTKPCGRSGSSAPSRSSGAIRELV